MEYLKSAFDLGAFGVRFIIAYDIIGKLRFGKKPLLSHQRDQHTNSQMLASKAFVKSENWLSWNLKSKDFAPWPSVSPFN